MDKQVHKVDMREFCAHFSEYLNASMPVAITCHGKIVRIYDPANHHPSQAQLAALKEAAIEWEKLLSSGDITEEELLNIFLSK